MKSFARTISSTDAAAAVHTADAARSRRVRKLAFAAPTVALVLACLVSSPDLRGQFGTDDTLTFLNAHGASRTVTVSGIIDFENPFFQSLGSNGRACVTCHQPDQAWSITPEHVRARFNATNGLDPLFRLNDGANSPTADVSTARARRAAFSMLLKKGLIRVGLPVPEGAEFELVGVQDPYGFASARELSLFRRPLPSTNLRFLSAVMWDGRESANPMTILPPGSDEASNIECLLLDLMTQTNNATRGHAEAAENLTDAQRRQIVDFEMGLMTAQVRDHRAGMLDEDNARGGPEYLSAQSFYIGINDNVADPNGPFNEKAMSLYDEWAQDRDPARRSVVRGETIFNSRRMVLTGVKGLNDNPYFGSPVRVEGTCTTCHNTPNVGNHSLAVPLDIGVSDAARRTPDMPLYTLRNRQTGELLQTTDPGRALITGKWADIGKFKGPILRALAPRAPYFHNGSAATLEEVADFYDERFGMRLTRQEKKDLVAFLRAL